MTFEKQQQQKTNRSEVQVHHNEENWSLISKFCLSSLPLADHYRRIQSLEALFQVAEIGPAIELND